MISGFVVGYGIVLANLFYLNNNPLSRFHGLKIMEFFYFLDLTEGEVQKFRQNRISPCVLCGGMVVQNGIYATTRFTVDIEGYKEQNPRLCRHPGRSRV